MHPEQRFRISGAGEDRERADRDGRIQPGEQTGRDAKREIDGAPGDRDRQDQDGDEDQERLAQAFGVAVARIGTDPGGTIEPDLGKPRTRDHHPATTTTVARRPIDGLRTMAPSCPGPGRRSP